MTQTVLTYLQQTAKDLWDFKAAINMIKGELNCSNEQCYTKLDSILKTKFPRGEASFWIDNWTELRNMYEDSQKATGSNKTIKKQTIGTQFNIKKVETLNNNQNVVNSLRKRKLKDIV